MSRSDLEPVPTASVPVAEDFPRHETGGPDSRVRYRVLGAVCSLAVLAYLHRVGFATAAPALKQQTGMSDLDVSYLMAAFMLAYGLVEVPFGMLGDRLGVRHLLVVLVVGWSVLTGLIAAVLWLPAGTGWPLAYLLTLRVLFGVFQGGMFPSTSRMLADWMPVDERGLAQGCIWTSARLGGALAPLVVVKLFSLLGTGPAAFWSLAAIGFVWCSAFWPWFRNTPEDMPGVNAAELRRIESGRPKGSQNGRDQGHGHADIPWSAMFASRSVWCLCLTYGALGLTGNFFITMLPTYLRTHRGFGEWTAGWLSAVPLACGVVGCVLGGYLSDLIIRRTASRRWGRRAVGGAGLAMGALALSSTIGVHEPVLLGVLLGLAFFGNDLAMGPAWASCADIGERYAGTLGGTMNMVGSFTGALGALLSGYLLKHGMVVPLFVILSSSYAVGALLWMGVDVTQTLAGRVDVGESDVALE
jgi:sugar phosphate permease